MRYIKFIIGTALVLAGIAWSVPPAQAERQLLDRVIAVVNNDVITQSELDVLFRPIYEQFKTEYFGSELSRKLNEARQKLLNQLIEDRLAFQEASKLGLEVDQSQIDAQLAEFRKNFENPGDLEKALKAEGVTMTDLEDRLRRQTMIRTLHDMQVRSRIIVSPKEIQEYYEANSNEFSAKESLVVRSLTIKKSHEARQKGLTDEVAQEKILDLRRKILKGSDFEAIAKEYSEDTRSVNGGKSEWITRGDMIPVIDDVIFSMKAGEVSDVIETPMGYHVFRVEEKRDGHRRTLDEAREEIRQIIFQKKSNERFQEWMQALKRDAFITIR